MFRCESCQQSLSVEDVALHECVAAPVGARAEPERECAGLRVKERVWSWLRTAAVYAGIIWFFGFAAVILGSLIWAWVRYIILSVAWPYFTMRYLTDALMEYLGPPPAPNAWVKAATVTSDTIQEVADSVTGSWLAPWLVVIATVVSTLTIMYCVASRSIRRAALRIQGYECEGMREGSTFTAGTWPKYQVAISEVGSFTTTHLGFGVRIGEWLVLPAHVRAGRTTLALAGPKAKLILAVPGVVASRMIQDVEYMWLPESTWSRLGVGKPTVSRSLTSVVQCAGLQGVSTGVLRRTKALGMLGYGGSTVPGMSGAAYTSAGQLIGMHLGAMLDMNTGVSVALLALEVRCIVHPEE